MTETEIRCQAIVAVMAPGQPVRERPCGRRVQPGHVTCGDHGNRKAPVGPSTTWMVAADPGEQHTGLALFRTWQTEDGGWCGECTAAWEAPPDEAIAYLAGLLDPTTDHHPKISTLVIEEFRLYEDKAMTLTGTELLTVEVIGVIRYLHRAGVRMGGTCEWVQQGARIKTATRKILRAKGITSKASGSTHGKDAELHGWYHLMHTIGGQPGTWTEPKPKKPAKKARH